MFTNCVSDALNYNWVKSLVSVGSFREIPGRVTRKRVECEHSAINYSCVLCDRLRCNYGCRANERVHLPHDIWKRFTLKWFQFTEHEALRRVLPSQWPWSNFPSPHRLSLSLGAVITKPCRSQGMLYCLFVCLSAGGEFWIPCCAVWRDKSFDKKLSHFARNKSHAKGRKLCRIEIVKTH